MEKIWPGRANFSFCLQNEAKVYKINTRWLGLKSDPGSRSPFLMVGSSSLLAC